tara:strand:- start:5545 stop:5823 length:279 start_codon:yes stop_codon:yes gene_type:complete
MYKFFSTPSHGYLAVPTADYEASGYKASRFSYKLGEQLVYLEEDCDARGFMDAFNVSLDDVKEVVIDYDLTQRKSLEPMSGEGFELRIGTGY